MDLATRLQAVEGFIKLINKDCRTINEINLNTFNLRMFLTSPRGWMEGVIYNGHDEWIRCMALVNNKLNENNELLIKIENEIWEAKNSSKKFQECVMHSNNTSRLDKRIGWLNQKIWNNKWTKALINLITRH